MDKNGLRSYLCRAVCVLALAGIGAGLRASAQTPSNDLSYEVATMKPVDPSIPFNGRHFWAHVTPAGASYWSMPVEALILYAYSLEPLQIVGPDWTVRDRFDIEARFAEEADKKDNRKMLQTLLKDRFKLAFHKLPAGSGAV